MVKNAIVQQVKQTGLSALKLTRSNQKCQIRQRLSCVDQKYLLQEHFEVSIDLQQFFNDTTTPEMSFVWGLDGEFE